MGIVPSIPAKPAELPDPLEIEIALSIDEWTDALLHLFHEARAKQRRRILTVFLPTLWFLTLLAAFSNWVTEPGWKDVAHFLRDAADLQLMPIGVFLGTATLLMLVSWLRRPRILRRRVRRMLSEDFTAPITVHYRFSESGIAMAEKDRSIFGPWSWIKALDETPDYLFFKTGHVDEPIVLPRHALSNETLMQARRWAETSIGRPAEKPLAPGPERAGTDAVHLRFALTAEDRTALLARQYDRPQARRQRFVGFVLMFLGFSLIWPVLYAFFWVVDPYRVPLAIAFPLYLDMFADLFWKPVAVFAVLVAGLMLVHPRLRMAAAGRMGRFLTQHARQGEFTVSIDEDGLATAQGEGRALFGWTSIRRIERAKDHVFLPVSRGTCIVLPRRAFDEAGLARFEALASHHLAASNDMGRT